jgi:hypothetical protein
MNSYLPLTDTPGRRKAAAFPKNSVFIRNSRPSRSSFRAANVLLSTIDMCVADFVTGRLHSNLAEVADGHRMLSRIRNSLGVRVGVRLVSGLLHDMKLPNWDFLRGYDPRWADVVDGRLVRLSRLSRLYRELQLEPQRRNTVLLKGRAGSGKTALLMRLAYELNSRGHVVAWVDRTASTSLKDYCHAGR